MGSMMRRLKSFPEALEKNPEHVMAHLGLAITNMQME